MENKENCKIVKDLLPSYIDGLTSEETNSFIEKHLEECKECHEIIENMKKDFEKERNELNKKSIKYAKKYKRKLKTVSILLIVIILIIFGCTFLRNAIIIKSLSNKAQNNVNMDNFHISWPTYSKEGITIFDIYYKNGQYLEKVNSFTYDTHGINNFDGAEVAEVITYYDGKSDKRMTFWEKEKVLSYREINENLKYPTIRPESMAQVTIYEENYINFIVSCFTHQISKANVNNVECYRFANMLSNSNNAIYFDISTGLTVRSQSGYSYKDIFVDTFSDVIYEFNVVTDEDFKLPNIEEYKVQDNTTK